MNDFYILTVELCDQSVPIGYSSDKTLLQEIIQETNNYDECAKTYLALGGLNEARLLSAHPLREYLSEYDWDVHYEGDYPLFDFEIIKIKELL